MDKIEAIITDNATPQEDKKASFFSFAANLNTIIVPKINQLIAEFNAAQEPEKTQKLAELETYYKECVNSFSDRTICIWPELQTQFIDKLFTQIQTEKKNREPNQLPAAGMKGFTDLIANMSPKNAQELSELLFESGPKAREFLTTGDNQNFWLLMQNMDSKIGAICKKEGLPDDFLNDFQIECLGGGNSKIFKITNTKTSERIVLKLEDRFGNPKSMDEKLTTDPTLKSTLTQKFADRPVTFDNPNNATTKITRNLQCIEYCATGDLSYLYSNQDYETDRETSAIGIYRQMARVLSDMIKSGVGMSDMKNSNWLLDENGVLRIADSKSFIPLDNNKKINRTVLEPLGYRVFGTPQIDPPEIDGYRKEDHDVDEMVFEQASVQMLGKNMYEFLTCIDIEDWKQDKEFSESEYDVDGFKGTCGQELKEMLQQMLALKPEERTLTLDQIATKLEKLEIKKLNADAIRLVNFTYPGPANETKRQEKIAEINAITDLEGLQKLLKTYRADLITKCEEQLAKPNAVQEHKDNYGDVYPYQTFFEISVNYTEALCQLQKNILQDELVVLLGESSRQRIEAAEDPEALLAIKEEHLAQVRAIDSAIEKNLSEFKVSSVPAQSGTQEQKQEATVAPPQNTAHASDNFKSLYQAARKEFLERQQEVAKQTSAEDVENTEGAKNAL